MDPITTAIVAALASLSKNVISDSYNVLKITLKKKFGSESDLIDAVEKLEKKPDSEGRKAVMQEEIEIAKANEDPEIIQLAQDLLNKIKEESGEQQIINQTQTNTNTLSNVEIGGNFEFKPVQKGGSQ